MNPAFPKEAIMAEIDKIIELAEWQIAGERLSGNVVKEEFFKGQKSAAEQIKLWLELRN